MRNILFRVILAAGLAAPAIAAHAAPPAAVAAQWQALTQRDVEAAYDLLENNHPGALAVTGDRAFVAHLKAAHELALERAATVTDFPGYLATLGGFADAMGDGHIRDVALYAPKLYQWPGFVAARRGASWVVAKEDRAVAGADLVGARIVACDGTPVDSWAREVLSFQTVASVAALEVVHSRGLLLDDGNPFVHWPKTCTFEKNGARQTLPLHWTRVFASELSDNYNVPVYGKAGYGVSRWRQGYWIAIQQLSYKAGAVVAAAKQDETALRNTPYVVIDLRGNGGGDDSYGRRLATILYGKARVEAMLGPDTAQGGCDETWRASPGNIAADTAMAEQFRKEGETTGAEGYRRAVGQMKAALAAGKALTGPVVCHDKIVSTARAPAAKVHGPVIVLTDSVCFSSCIGTVGFFHKLGAVQVGMETGADTHYGEVRRIVLPSGLSVFSTLQAIEPDEPLHLGPYAPARRFTFGGDIADTAAVRAWIAKRVLPKLAAGHSGIF